MMRSPFFVPVALLLAMPAGCASSDAQTRQAMTKVEGRSRCTIDLEISGMV